MKVKRKHPFIHIAEEKPDPNLIVFGYDIYYDQLLACSWDGIAEIDEGMPRLLPIDGDDDVLIPWWFSPELPTKKETDKLLCKR